MVNIFVISHNTEAAVSSLEAKLTVTDEPDFASRHRIDYHRGNRPVGGQTLLLMQGSGETLRRLRDVEIGWELSDGD